jgi:ferritin
MNEYDRSQFNFIMGLSDEQFEEWALSVPDDDIQYALELIQTARTEAFMLEQELMDQLVDSDLSEARKVLQKFRL